jgi:hypothetical protein
MLSFVLLMDGFPSLTFLYKVFLFYLRHIDHIVRLEAKDLDLGTLACTP